MFGRIGGIAAVVLSKGYTLIQIQDEQVPLGLFPQVENQYFGVAVGVVTAMLLAGACTVYLMACQRYRARIRQLDRERKCYCGWHLRHLRETAGDLELEETAYMEKEMQNFFSKKIPKAEPF